MPVLITDAEQHQLTVGANALGGIGDDAVGIPALADLPRVAIIRISADRPATIQRLSPRIVVKLGGETLGAVARELQDGAVIEVGGLRLRYGASIPAETSTAKPKASELATEVLPAMSAPGRPARLVGLTSGQTAPISARELTVGRGEDCGLVLTGKGLSRRHAVIRAAGATYTVTDESTNGTFVNGERVVGTRPLSPGDIVAFGDEQFRFEFTEPAGGRPGIAAATAVLPGVKHDAPVLAELEISAGPEAGRVHRIARRVCAIGRGTQNDVTIAHESVSSSHASLMLKGDTWYLTDLHSANGTYVDGYRIAGERALPSGCTLRMGKVELQFRPRTAQTPSTNGTRVLGGGMLRRIMDALSPQRD